MELTEWYNSSLVYVYVWKLKSSAAIQGVPAISDDSAKNTTLRKYSNTSVLSRV